MSVVVKTEVGAPPIPDELESIPTLPEKDEKLILEDMRELLSDPGRWVQGYYATDKHGWPVDDYEHAERFCAVGALHRTASLRGLDGSWGHIRARRALDAEIDSSLIEVNDSVGGYEKVMKALDRALARF